MLADKQQGIRQ